MSEPPPRLTPTFVTTPSGDEMVIITRELYDRLIGARGTASEISDSLEDEADAAEVLRARKTWIADGRPTVPLAVYRRVAAGDSYLRAFRLHREMGQPELAEKAGIAQGYLSEIERGLKSPNESIRRKLAEILDIQPILLENAAEEPKT